MQIQEYTKLNNYNHQKKNQQTEGKPKKKKKLHLNSEVRSVWG